MNNRLRLLGLRRIRRGLLVPLAALAGGCGALTHVPGAGITQPVVITAWPSPGDYTTIKTAVAARDDALFRQTDWRRRAFTASLASQTLLTVRIKAGSCFAFVGQLYANLRDLMDAYPGEDWRPLARLVRRQPSVATACLPPRSHLTAVA
jgi:hypothetical protein